MRALSIMRGTVFWVCRKRMHKELFSSQEHRRSTGSTLAWMTHCWRRRAVSAKKKSLCPLCFPCVRKKNERDIRPPTSHSGNIYIVCTSSSLLVVQQNKKTMSYAWVHTDFLMNHFVCVYHNDQDVSSFMSPRMDRPGHLTQWSHSQHVEIVRMDTSRNRVRILVENDHVACLHRESQGV